jgi:hypothetical protein
MQAFAKNIFVVLSTEFGNNYCEEIILEGNILDINALQGASTMYFPQFE